MVDKPRAPAPALSITAIGASSMGAGGAPSVTAPVNELTQCISRNSRMTCRKVNSAPIASTPRMRPFKPGLALKAIAIC